MERTHGSSWIDYLRGQVTQIDTVFKLSQDGGPGSYRMIIEKLKERGEDGRKIAAVMEHKMKVAVSWNGVA